MCSSIYAKEILMRHLCHRSIAPNVVKIAPMLRGTEAVRSSNAGSDHNICNPSLFNTPNMTDMSFAIANDPVPATILPAKAFPTKMGAPLSPSSE